ncbi:MAG: hypothetical protein IKL96_07385 [Kiritimatiellae bacterium]|nr:hypothetical protein [Kiritimatiellia bacterium]
MANNIQDGVYNAMPTVAAVYEKNDALKLEIHFTLCDGDGNAYTQTGSDGNEYPIEKYKYYNLVNAQGAVNTKVVESICAWSKWDGTDPFWWTDVANVDAIGMVEVTLETEPAFNDPSKTYQNIKWVNELGHSAKFSGAKITESGDKASIMAKYGAKFKAAFGGKPRAIAQKPAQRPQGASALPARKTAAPAPKAPVAAPARPHGVAPAAQPAYSDGTAGANAVWDAFSDANKGVPNRDLEERWFAAIDKHSDGKDQADMTGEQWAAVAAELLGGGDAGGADDGDNDMPF